MNDKDMAPGFKKKNFICPHCGVYAQQEWFNLGICQSQMQIGDFSFCNSCNGYTIWLKQKMIYPLCSIAPLPAEDMPEEVKEDFNEARDVVNISPRSAAALLRLALQKLMIHFGEKGRKLDDDIGNLVKGGLPLKVQQSLDIVRVIGNNAVHPGQIDLKDDKDTAISLFKLMNVIVEHMITEPKNIDEIFTNLPDSSKDAIEKRDTQIPPEE